MHIAILGCGSMGSVLLQGWLKQKDSKTTYTAYTRTEASLAKLQKEYPDERVTFISGDRLGEAVKDADLVLLGFAPSDLHGVLRTSGLAVSLRDKAIVTMLAGVSIEQVQTAVATNSVGVDIAADLKVARIIPTLAAKIGESVTLLAVDPKAKEPAHYGLVDEVFGQLGSVQRVPESLMNEATAIGAAVHALAIVAVDAATDASVADGVPRSVASALVAQSLRSCSGLMAVGDMSPEQVKAAMSTPAGITLNSLVHLDAHARAGITGAVRHAIQYTRGMGS